MSALLKIVQGPNAGAEIALPDGVEITIGKADSCDIVLADPTLPDAPLRLSAISGGTVSAVVPPAEDPAPLSPAHVFFYGSSALAVGPADTPWPPLVFPAPAGSESDSPAESGADDNPPEESATPAASESGTNVQNPEPEKSKSAAPRRVVLILLAVLAVIILLLLVFSCARVHVLKKRQPPPPAPVLADYATRYGLSLDDSGSRPAFSGNFATRADRLAATADLYANFPGVALDLTDDESLRGAVSDSLFTLEQASLTVASVSNRVATLTGTAASPAALSAALEALRADVPRLAGIDTSAVTLRAPVAPDTAEPPTAPSAPTRRRGPRAPRAAAPSPAEPEVPSLPVCGILTTPYPCLVLQNGSRVFAGATLGDSVVVSIAPDSVVLTNANGSFTWKP